MKVDVHWIIDGVMSVEANSADEGEKAVSELLTAFIQSHPELTSHFGAKSHSRPSDQRRWDAGI
jgi:hypothetical protein